MTEPYRDRDPTLNDSVKFKVASLRYGTVRSFKRKIHCRTLQLYVWILLKHFISKIGTEQKRKKIAAYKNITVNCIALKCSHTENYWGFIAPPQIRHWLYFEYIFSLEYKWKNTNGLEYK